MEKIRNFLDKTIMGICVILFIFMTVVGTYQIASRYIFKSPSTVSEELISYSFAWMSMFAASYVFSKREHMRMVFFVEQLKQKTQIYISILSEITILLFVVFVLIQGGEVITSLTMNQVSPALKISMGYVYSVLPTCGIVTAIYSILNINVLVKELKEVK